MDKRVQNVKNEEVNKKIIKNCPNVLRECNNGYNEINSQSTKNSKKVEIYEDGLEHVVNLLDDVQKILFNEISENRINDAIDSLKGIQDEIQNIQTNVANVENEIEIHENGDENSDEDNDEDVDKDIDEDNDGNDKKSDHFPLDLSVDLDNIKKALELTPCEDSSKNIVFCVGSGFKSLLIGMKNNLINDTKNLIGWKGWKRLRNPLNLNISNIIHKIKYSKQSSNNSENDEKSSLDDELGINFNELKNDYLGVKSLLKSTKSDHDKKESELKKIKENIDLDYGPDNVFRSLYNKCYDVEASG